MRTIWIIGAGGHAKVVIETLRATGTIGVLGALDDDPTRQGTEVRGVPVRGEVSLGSIDRFGIEHAIMAVGSNRARAEMVRRLAGRVSWTTAIHPTAHLAPGVHIGKGSVVFAGAIVQPDSVIGRHVILNTASSVDHDVMIGDFAHIAPGVRVAGNVRVEEGALLGIGCSVAPGCTVGAWATIGAGSVVVHDIPPGVTAKGTPARLSKI
jgi:UDP-perosamine 4-acetyltransferase